MLTLSATGDDEFLIGKSTEAISEPHKPEVYFIAVSPVLACVEVRDSFPVRDMHYSGPRGSAWRSLDLGIAV